MTKQRSAFIAAMFMTSLVSLYFFANFQRAAVPGPIFNELQTGLHLDAKMVTGIGAAFLYVYSFMQLVTGLLADRYGGCRIIAFGSVIFAVGSVIFPLSDKMAALLPCVNELWIICGARMLTGIGAGMIYLSAVKEIDRLYPRSFTKVLGVSMLVGYCGSAFANTPLIWATHRFGWRAALMGTGVLICLSALTTLFFFLRIDKPEVNRMNRLFSLAPYLDVFRNRNLMAMLTASPLMYASYYIMLTTVGKKLLEDAGGFSSHTAGVLTMCMVVICAGCQLIPGAIEKAVNYRRKMLFMGQLTIGWGGVAVALAGTLIPGWGRWLIALGLWMLAVAGGCTPLTTSLFREVSNPAGIGVALSLSNFCVYLIAGAGANFSGVLLEFFGRGHIERTATAVIYPARSYVALLVMLLALISVAIVRGLRVPETNGKNIYKAQ